MRKGYFDYTASISLEQAVEKTGELTRNSQIDFEGKEFAQTAFDDVNFKSQKISV